MRIVVCFSESCATYQQVFAFIASLIRGGRFMRVIFGSASMPVPIHMPRRRHLAYPHTATDPVNRLGLLSATATQIIAPFEAMDEVIRQDDLPLDMELVISAKERMRVRFHSDGHVEWVLDNQRSIVEVGHLGLCLACNQKRAQS